MPSSPGPHDYTRAVHRFFYRGISLLPQDALPEGKVAYASNIRSFQEGTVSPRYGLCKLLTSALPGPIHSVFRLNDPALFGGGPAETRVLGSTTGIYRQTVGNGATALIDSGYSGNPLMAVSAAPVNSPQPWTYIADFLRMRKVGSGSVVSIGLPTPTVPPTAVLASPEVTYLNTVGTAVWSSYGGAGEVDPTGVVPTVDRINTVLTQLLYDAGVTGMASVSMSDMTNLTVGATMDIGASPETIIVQEINPAVSPTTIAAILYDVGTSGLCTIQPTGSFAMGQVEAPLPEEIRRRYEDLNLPVPPRITISRTMDFPVNCLVLISSVEVTRILSVAVGRDGVQSFRCSLGGTYAPGTSIDGIPAFRAYFNTTKAVGNPAIAKVLENTITPVAEDESATGGVQSPMTGSNRNWSKVGARATQPGDFISFGIRVDQIVFVTYVRLLLSLDADTAVAGEEFLRNYYQYEWRANDLVKAIQASAGTAPDATTTLAEAQAEAVEKGQVDAFYADQFGDDPLILGGRGGSGPLIAGDQPEGRTDGFVSVGSTASRQLTLGNGQWITLHCRVADLTRVGTDSTKTLGDIKAAAIVLQVLGTTSDIVVNYSDAYLQGGYGPDVGMTNPPYVYRYRYRSTLTGERSNPSPPMRAGVSPRRGRVGLTGTQSAESQCDVVDWFRFGGSLARWAYVVTSPNDSPPTVNDDMADTQIDGGEGLRTDLFQPWPVSDLPRKGTCNVAGTAVEWVSGATFNLNWSADTPVIVNGRATSLYRSPVSTTRFETVDNCGSGTGVAFSFPSPLLKGQPLPAIWGGPINNVWFHFACGDQTDPGALHWTHGNDPDASSDVNVLVVSSASEPLIAGCVFDGVAYVFSTERLYRLVPTFGEITTFRAVETACTRGLWTRKALCVGPDAIYFLSKDGIYRTTGGAEQECLTQPDIANLFPQDGAMPESVRGLAPVNYCDSISLEWVDQMLYFDYPTLESTFATLVYEPRYKRWTPDTYLTGIRTRLREPGQVVHDQVLGGVNGLLYQVDSSLLIDDTTPIAWSVWTPWPNGDDPRALKQWGDAAIDLHPGGSINGITVIPVLQNGNVPLTSTVVGIGGILRNTYIIDLSNGAGPLSRNCGLQISGSVVATDTQRPLLYLWEAAFLNKQVVIAQRATDWEDLGYKGAKFVQGVVLRANTFNNAKQLQVQYDGTQAGPTLTVQHNAERQVAYPLGSLGWTPFVAELVRMISVDTLDWTLLDWRWIWEPAPEKATHWETQDTTFDLPGFGSVRDAVLAYESDGPTTLRIYHGAIPLDYTIPSSGGIYVRNYFPFQAAKGKSYRFRWTGDAPFRVFEKDTSMRVQGWGIPGGYRVVAPFGGPHRAVGAEV